MLHRVIYASEAIGSTGSTTLSIAQILGVSERNNRRDHISGCLMFHQGHILQVLEGGRGDIDRLLRRLRADLRHTGLKILSDIPVDDRRLLEPMAFCADPAAILGKIGQPCISLLSANDAERLLALKAA